MKSIYWGIVAATIALDAAILVSPLPMSTTTGAFAGMWALHALCCAVLASSTLRLLPARYQQRPVWAWLMMFDFAFIAPVLGPIGILLVARATSHRRPDQLVYAKPQALSLPEYDVRTQDPQRAGQGAIRSRLGSGVPASIRMQSLLTLQAVPSRVANPIREELLGDAADDVRLVAFGMLDAEEKRLSKHIHREQANLQMELSARARFDCLVHLAELHWELIYAGLVQGELRKHVLGEARGYIDAALALGASHESGHVFLKGKILLAQGEDEQAEQAFDEALKLGHSEVSVIPFLAELAFRRHEFRRVRASMQHLFQHHAASRVMPVVAFWNAGGSTHPMASQRAFNHL